MGVQHALNSIALQAIAHRGGLLQKITLKTLMRDAVTTTDTEAPISHFSNRHLGIFAQLSRMGDLPALQSMVQRQAHGGLGLELAHAACAAFRGPHLRLRGQAPRPPP